VVFCYRSIKQSKKKVQHKYHHFWEPFREIFISVPPRRCTSLIMLRYNCLFMGLSSCLVGSPRGDSGVSELFYSSFHSWFPLSSSSAPC
jgi:hypothetical protein